jgi:hypothetical protein
VKSHISCLSYKYVYELLEIDVNQRDIEHDLLDMKYDDLLDKQVTCTPRMLSSGDSRLCYNQLLLKFSGEELSLNISLSKMGNVWHAAMDGLFNPKSKIQLQPFPTFCLHIEQSKEGKESYMPGLPLSITYFIAYMIQKERE